MAEDYKGYDSTATAANIAGKLADCFIEIIRTTAGTVPQSELERQKLLKQALELKLKYGEYLKDEVGNVCAFPGCGRILSQSENGATVPLYEVAVIDRAKLATVDNLLAFCPMCQVTYSFDSNKKTCKELAGVKKIIVARNQSMRLLDGMPLEKEIIGVMKKIKKAEGKRSSRSVPRSKGYPGKIKSR